MGIAALNLIPDVQQVSTETLSSRPRRNPPEAHFFGGATAMDHKCGKRFEVVRFC